MKFVKLSQVILLSSFALSLFIDQQAFAGQQAFVLTSADNNVVGHGKFEELPDSIARIAITMKGQEYTGTGVVSKSTGISTLSMQKQAIRADRALLNMKHKKHVTAMLDSTVEGKLACELNVVYEEIWGQCVNPGNEQVFSIKTVKGESP